ncbi:DNA-processing protein DprA [Kitasatospora sp. NA04385]|uniref:DNA-processing protein DprA n=1 Tax=Kitasatospora sp. NA04385 TaxID=2742135 RepID=UPI0020CAA25F|nr:DNA-processing protein DprA [Kitasatospora sp. NA04385]
MTAHLAPRAHADLPVGPPAAPIADRPAPHDATRRLGLVRPGGAGAGPTRAEPSDGPCPPHPPDAPVACDGGERLRRPMRGAGPPAVHRSRHGPTEPARAVPWTEGPNTAGPPPEGRPDQAHHTAGAATADRPLRTGTAWGERRVIRPTAWAAPTAPPDPPEPERISRAALTRLIEPGDAAIGRAVQRLGAVRLVQGFYEGAPASRLGLGADRIAAYQERLRKFNPATDLERIARLGGKFIIPGDSEWPSQLDDLGDGRPVGLWVRGLPSQRLPSLRLLALRSVAVVGSRACTAYGRHIAGQLGSELAERGWVVVSGAAHGVDTAAHLGALAVNGMTIAVLASGVDICYPRGNEALIERIGRDGLLVSELALGMNPTRFRFVLRNRVIAALTRGTVVVEAASRSGALSTARRARDLNRHTMGIPGPITSELSAGVHTLIRSGAATMVTSGAEVGELIGSIGADLAPERAGPLLPRDALEPPVARVLEAVPASADGAPVQRLAHYAALSETATVQHLHELSSLGFVERHGAHWRLVRRK